MIDRKRLEAQLASLERQEQIILGNLHECRGAARQCRHFLGQIDRAGAQAAGPEAGACAADGGADAAPCGGG